jgi:dTDP-4-dehydrorhamnose 3,5-epimerase
MIFKETRLKGAFVIEIEKFEDKRGFFAHTFSRDAFESNGLTSRLVNTNISFNKKRGTLRGMHYQVAPYEETKLIRCTRGAIYDVIIDLRPDSPSYRNWVEVELTADNYRLLYVPEQCAHGFQTLDDNTEVTYQVSQVYSPESARGVRYDDPAFKITWPLKVEVISDQDAKWPHWSP